MAPSTGMNNSREANTREVERPKQEPSQTELSGMQGGAHTRGEERPKQGALSHGERRIDLHHERKQAATPDWQKGGFSNPHSFASYFTRLLTIECIFCYYQVGTNLLVAKPPLQSRRSESRTTPCVGCGSSLNQEENRSGFLISVLS